MALDFRDGCFGVSVCVHGHVTLEAVDGDAVTFVAVMSRSEAADLASRLGAAARTVPLGRRRSISRRTH